MILRPLVTPAAPPRAETGFSLIEVTLAIGILAFCLVPLMGLLPTGLNAQHSATEGAAAADALTMLSTAVHSSQFVSRGTGGAVTYRLPKYLSDIASAPSDPPSNSNSVSYTSGGSFTEYVYAVMEDGTIRKSTDTKQARLTMYIKIFPPATDAQILSGSAPAGGTPSAAVRVRALVAWPSLPADTTSAPATTLTKLKSRQGYVESYISYVPNQ